MSKCKYEKAERDGTALLKNGYMLNIRKMRGNVGSAIDPPAQIKRLPRAPFPGKCVRRGPGVTSLLEPIRLALPNKIQNTTEANKLGIQHVKHC